MKRSGKIFIFLSHWERVGVRAYGASTPIDVFLSLNASRHHTAQKENGILAQVLVPDPSPKWRREKTILTILFLAILSGCVKTVSDQPTPEAARQFLKLRGYEFTEQSFFSAAAVSDVMAVNGFFSAGINPNAKDENGDTVLTAASARGDLKIVETLLRGGVDINAQGRKGWPALLLALEGEHDPVADLLAGQSKIDLKAETPNGMTALMLAVWHQRPELVRKLLQLHSDPNHQDKDGDAALHGASWYGNTKIARMLLDAGANPNIKNKLGGTALMWAASYGQGEVVRMLLERGADPRIKDVDGVTAGGWAAKNGRANLVKLLQEAQKKR
jgi:ankyrin repeat protein